MGAFQGRHVRWLRDRDDALPVVRRCLGCGVEASMPPVVEATDVVDPSLWRRFVRCPACGTYLLEPPDMPDYGGRLAGRLSPDPYIEIGAGVDFIAMLLSAVPPARRSSARLLDVGCGCGFSVHLWRSSGREGLGVEPSALGEAGIRRLLVPIVRGYAGSAPELEGRVFDVVLSSEVVEHVPDPAAFLGTLAALRAPGGLVVLSTPDTRPLDDPDADDLEAWEVLSPGFHTCVLSEAALHGLCSGAGLSAARIERVANHLVCVAGEDVSDAVPDPAGARREYGEYLRRELGRRPTDRSLRDGLAFRLFQHLMAAGEWAEARAVRDRLAASLAERYGEEVLVPDACRRRAETITDAARIGDEVPWFALELHHALGILEAATGGSPGRARDHFRFVAGTAPRLAALDPTYLPTAVSWAYNSLFQAAALDLASGSTGEMESFLALEQRPEATGLGFAPGREILALASAALFAEHVRAGRSGAARSEEERVGRLLGRALGVPRLEAAALASSVIADPRAAAAREALLQATVRSLLASATLRLEADRDPAAAVTALEGALALLEAIRRLPSGARFAEALGPELRGEHGRAQRSRAGEEPAPRPRSEARDGLGPRIARRLRRLLGGRPS